ncbi:MAG: hypothetical protein ACE5GX_07575 [Thermoanaerobaculia bacterium]
MTAKYKPVLLTIAAVAAVIGVLGLLDVGNQPYAGYFSGPDNSVVRVFPDSPADSTGLEVGDVVKSIGGIDVTDTKANSRRPRAKVGESRAFVIERNGSEQTLELTYSGLPSRNRTLAIAGALIGFCFLLLPLWAYHRAASNSTLILALFGLCFGAAFLPGPYSESYLLRTVGGAIATSAVIMGFAFLVHYLMQFPKKGAFLEKPWARKLIYVPAILLAIFFLFLAIAQPDATGGFNRVVGLLVGVFIVGFFGWAVVGVILRFVRSSGAERAEHGLTLMLIGTLGGLLPLILSSLLGAVAPDVQANLPGIQFFFLSLVLIPLCFSMAAIKSARA